MLVLIIQKVNCYIFELKMAIFVHHILKCTFCAQNDSFCTSHSQTYIFSSKWAFLYITFFLLPNSSIIICKHYECILTIVTHVCADAVDLSALMEDTKYLQLLAKVHQKAGRPENALEALTHSREKQSKYVH